MKSLFRLLLVVWICAGSIALAQNTRTFLQIEPSGTTGAILTVNPGQNVQFTARAYEYTAAGTKVEIPITSIVWSVDPASFGTITAQGLFTAAAANSSSNRGVITATAVVGNMTLTASVAVILSPQGGHIRGTVTVNTGQAAPLSGVQVTAIPRSNTNPPSNTTGYRAWTNAQGNYDIVGLPDGAYTVFAAKSGYVTQYFDGKADAASSDAVTITSAGTVNDVDFSLDIIPPTPIYTISGTVRDNNGNPVAGALVQAEMSNTPNLRPFMTRSANDGSYTLDVPAGSYVVWSSAYGFATEFFDNTPDRTLATMVTLDSSTPARSGVDFSLEPYGGSIAGTIRDANGNPIAGANVTAWVNGRPSTNAAGAAYGRATSASDGSYLIAGLPQGDFVVRAQAGGFIAEYYAGVTDITAATLVTVATQPVTGIDFSLDAGSSISGIVTNEDTNAPLGYATVIVRATQAKFERGARTDAQGAYTIDGLPAGTYTVFASAYRFIGEYYNNAATAAQAATITLAASGTVTGIDFALTPAPTAPRLYRGNVVSRGGQGGLVTVVEAINPSTGMVLSTGTDSRGSFEFQAWDNAVLRARALGYVGLYAGGTRNWKESRWEGATGEMTFTLDPVAENGLAVFNGEVKEEASGAGLSNAWVYGMDAAGNTYFSVTGADGTFSIPNTANGSLDVMISHVGFETGGTSAEINDAHGSGTISAQRSTTTSVADPAALPSTPRLYQNYPNPFNPATTISYTIPERMHVSIRVYDLLGRVVDEPVNAVLDAGAHNLAFDATRLPSGIYLYRLEAGSSVQIRRMMLMK